MAVGLNEVFKAIFDDDLVSADPADWVALYPSRYTLTSQVPTHFYKSLKDLVLPAATNADYKDHVIALFGEDLTMEDFGIGISVRGAESGDVMDDENDEVGAEVAVVQIIVRVRQPVPAGQEKLCEIVHLRIRQLIDCLTRQKMGFDGVIPWQYIALDSTIDSEPSDENQGVYCRWRQHKDLSNALQQIAIYSCHYNRLFLPGT